MKNSYDTIRNRTRDLPLSSAVPQPTATPRNPVTFTVLHVNTRCNVMYWAHRPTLQVSVTHLNMTERCQGGSHHNADRMTYFTSQNTSILQYVCVDASSDCNVERKIYYIHHTYMDFFQYVSDNESSDTSFEWKIYYALHRCTDVPQYVRIDASSDESECWTLRNKVL